MRIGFMTAAAFTLARPIRQQKNRKGIAEVLAKRSFALCPPFSWNWRNFAVPGHRWTAGAQRKSNLQDPSRKRVSSTRRRPSTSGLRTVGERKVRALPDGLANASNRPFADLQGRSSERARSARKRSSTNAEVAPMRRSLAATERKTAQAAAASGRGCVLRTGAVSLSVVVSGERLSQAANCLQLWFLTTVMHLGRASVVWPIACPRKHLAWMAWHSDHNSRSASRRKASGTEHGGFKASEA